MESTLSTADTILALREAADALDSGDEFVEPHVPQPVEPGPPES